MWYCNILLWTPISLYIQYIPRNMHTVFALLCFVVVIHWPIFPYPSCLLHWHCGNLTIAPVPAKQPWWIWIDTSCEFIMNDCITTTKQSTTKPCAYFLGYTVYISEHPAVAPTQLTHQETPVANCTWQAHHEMTATAHPVTITHQAPWFNRYIRHIVVHNICYQFILF